MTTDRRTAVAECFRNHFGRDPELWSRAPGRADLMGSHTDYNEGYVLTMSIDYDVWIAAAPSKSNLCRVYSMNLEDVQEIDLANLGAFRHCEWSRYLSGVLETLSKNGLEIQSFDGVIHSTVPIGGGLSSSAALESATAVLTQALCGWEVDKKELALLCQKAENECVGVNCGILDQYTSILGEAGAAIVLDCRMLTHKTSRIPSGLVAVICNTNAPRKLSRSEYGTRRAQCEEGARILAEAYPKVKTLRDVSLEQFEEKEADLSEADAKRCRFIIEENRRVLDLAKALEADDRASIRHLCADSFAGARDLYEISVPAMEAMIRAMLTGPGCIGARQAGAGFGGCMIAWVLKDRVEEFETHVMQAYEKETGIEPDVYPVEAAAGAGMMDYGSSQ